MFNVLWIAGIYQQSISKSNNDLKIGDRVIISSGQGSKLGFLRYRGTTQFAQGEWCGIELDDPLGKNNGSVDGIKYLSFYYNLIINFFYPCDYKFI